jgi:hypothetical protein
MMHMVAMVSQDKYQYIKLAATDGWYRITKCVLGTLGSTAMYITDTGG